MGALDPAARSVDILPEDTRRERMEVHLGRRADPVNHPTHYTTGKIEVIDFIEDQQLGFHLGNVVKYICRSKHKGQEAQDLKKARWYLERFIQSYVEDL